MLENPYKYVGPLDPISDALVCIPRQKQLDIVSKGVINNDEFWAVLGPRQIGKTTFLRQIEKKYPEACYIYFNFEISPDTTDSFYQWVKKQFIEKIPHESAQEQKKDTKKYTPEFNFLNFLEKFQPKQRDKKIVLLFDEIEKIPSVASFLHLWRKLYHDRYHKEQLNQYGVVMTGSVILLNLTVGSSSPFNIAQTMYLNDLPEEDSSELIEKPFDQLGISIDEEAKKKLISYVGGHPQILQQSCYLLVNRAVNKSKGKTINEDDISEVFNHLLITSSVIDTLMQDIKTNHQLKNLLLDILTGKKKKYYLHKEFSIGGAGPIIEDRNSFCKIRNRIIENYLKDFFAGETELLLDERIKTFQEHTTGPIEMASNHFDVFFIFDENDKDLVETIANQLKLQEINPFIEQLSLSQDTTIKDEIKSIMNSVHSIALFVGGGIAPWENVEKRIIIREAVEKEISVITVILPGVNRKVSFPDFLRGFDIVNFQAGINASEPLNRLRQWICDQKTTKDIKEK